MRRSMYWTLEDMVDGLFVCATLTRRRGDRTPFVQAGEAVKPDPGCSWEGHSKSVTLQFIERQFIEQQFIE